MKIKYFILFFCLLVTNLAHTQTYITQWEIEKQSFGEEEIYKLKKNGEPLGGDYKISENNQGYIEATFQKGRLQGVCKWFNNRGLITAEKSYQNGILHGKTTIYRSFGDESYVESVKNFKNGVLDGEMIEYESSGKPKAQTNYRSGKPHGEWKYYDFQTGKLSRIEIYKDGKADGKWWKEVGFNGTKITITEYYKDGEPVGKWTEQWGNGQLKKERVYTGKGTYTSKEYHENGTIFREESRKEGVPIGVTKVYNEAGVLILEEHYIGSQDEAPIKIKKYFDNGKLKEETRYEGGREHGKYIKMNENGAKQVEGTYHRGYKNGLWKVYFPKGNLLYAEMTYKKGVVDGEFKQYDEKGTLVEEGNFENDYQEGLWKYYDSTKKLVKEIIFDKGNVIKTTDY